MAANIEHQLLCKIVETGDFHTVEKMKIHDGYFLGDQSSQYKEVFRAIAAHYKNPNTAGQVPSYQLLQHWFPWFPWVHTYDSVAALCVEMRKAKLRYQVIGLADEIMLKVEADPHVALDVLREATAKLQIEHESTNDALITDAYDTLLAEYRLVQASQGVTGIPFPWKELNEDTQGIHDEDFIIIFGRPKSMKSWIAYYIATETYYRYRKRVLIWSMEMSRVQSLRRCSAIMGAIDYEKFKNGKLDPASEEKLFHGLWWLREQEKAYKNPETGREAALLISAPFEERSDDGIGVSALQAKIREFQPDLVLVDGMYLMRDDREKRRSIDWKLIAHISQDLKGTCKTFKVPIIATTQANRTAKDPKAKDADLTELAYADALAQDCDLAMRVHKQKSKAGDLELAISIPGSREGKLDGFVINGYPATNFTFKRFEMQDPSEPKEEKRNGHNQKGPALPVVRSPPAINWRQT